ncbi:hypothetical protein PAXRUDRAFT_825776 [Paxillus rubicundulus Ve08.2h10]|uniref:Secreted protein n=1 Tax=Paxillus rubicundulus Ve08.2h10 TaxID=930991 RepID=A0A0D0EAG6_9AGAM|nr:hypothetical protein PAXRUDRAFT_825776 [Paxillus rubicundulus Ve08.2h10]
MCAVAAGCLSGVLSAAAQVVFTLSRLHESKYSVIYHLKEVLTLIMSPRGINYHGGSLSLCEVTVMVVIGPGCR